MTFNGAKHHLELVVGGKRLVGGGWRIDKDEDRLGEDEWLLYMGWERVGEYSEWAEMRVSTTVP